MNPESSLPDIEARMAEMIDRAERLSQRLVDAEYEASSQDEMVTAVVGTGGILKRIDLATTAKRRLDNLSLGDAITEAVLAAEHRANQAQRELMAEMMGGNETALRLWTRAEEVTNSMVNPQP